VKDTPAEAGRPAGPWGGLWPRHQPPVHSPIPFRGVPAATAAALRLGRDPRPLLSDIVARDLGADRAVLCGSGTQALQLALLVARRWTASDAVALPAFSCYDVASAAVGSGARIQLYDMDPATLGPDLDSLRRALEGGARTVVVAPLYGIPLDWDALVTVAEGYGAELVEDAAQGHGATWLGRPLGTLGRLSVLSLGRGKGWTGGRGGVLLLRGGPEEPAAWQGTLPDYDGRVDPGIGQELSVLTAAVTQAVAARPSFYALPSALPWLGLGETRYHPPASTASITRAGAALALRSRGAAREEAVARRANGFWYDERLRSNRAARTVALPSGASAGFLRFPVRLRAGLGTFTDSQAARRLGIAPGYPSTMLALEPIRARLADKPVSCPGADDLVRTLVTLPTHSRLSARERGRILRMLGSVLSHPASSER
jgi:perosamine synthetase